MARSCNPLFIVFAIACIVLFAAFNSHHGESLKNAAASFGTDAFNSRNLASKLALYERLWKENIKGRKELREYYAGRDTAYPKGFAAPYNLYDFVYPAFNCPHELERVGKSGDGGKWICGMTRYEANKKRPCVIYSFGVNDDSAFENSVLGRTNCEIWGYDYSVNGWAKNLDQSLTSRAHFLKAGVANVTNTNHQPPFYSIKDMMQMNGHSYIDIMKMDIEGSEFDALNSLLADFQNQPLPIGQLLLEAHAWEPKPDLSYTVPKSLDEWISFWESLEARGLREYAVEPNLLGNTWYGSPVFAEVSLINTNDPKGLLIH